MRELIERKRQDALIEIHRLQAKIDIYDELLAEMGDVPVADNIPVFTGLTPPPKKTRARPNSGKIEAVELALEAAGDNGITARELAEVASVPVGTASGRLSLMKNEGRARHDPPRYFAVHSKHEDNNTDHGIEQ